MKMTLNIMGKLNEFIDPAIMALPIVHEFERIMLLQSEYERVRGNDLSDEVADWIYRAVTQCRPACFRTREEWKRIEFSIYKCAVDLGGDGEEERAILEVRIHQNEKLPSTLVFQIDSNMHIFLPD